MSDSGFYWRRDTVARLNQEIEGADCRVANGSIVIYLPVPSGKRFDSVTTRLLTRKVNAAALLSSRVHDYPNSPFSLAGWAVIRKTNGDTAIKLLFRPERVDEARQRKAARMYITRARARGESVTGVLLAVRQNYQVDEEWVQRAIKVLYETEQQGD